MQARTIQWRYRIRVTAYNSSGIMRAREAGQAQIYPKGEWHARQSQIVVHLRY